MSITNLTKKNETIKVHKRTFYIRTSIFILITNLLTLTFISFNENLESSNIEMPLPEYYQLNKTKTLINVLPSNPLMLNHLEQVSVYSQTNKKKIVDAKMIDPVYLSPQLKSKIINGNKNNFKNDYYQSELQMPNEHMIVIEINKDEMFKLFQAELNGILILPRNSIKPTVKPIKKTIRRKYEFKY